MLLLPLWATLAAADPIVYDITQGGTKIGESAYEMKPDGSFTSTTKIEVMTVKIESSLSGQFKNGLLVSFELKQKQPEVDMKVKYANGKGSAVVNGKDQPPRAIKLNKALFSNYHPGLLSTIFKGLSSSLEGAQKVKLSILEGGGAEVEVTVTPKSPRKISKDGSEVTIRPFTLEIGGQKVDMAIREDGNVVLEGVATQKVAFIARGYEGVLVDPVAKYKELSQPTFEVKVERGIAVDMRDGAKLVHDVAMPVGDGKYPTILVRTPYGREGNMLGAEWWAKRGYVYIVQDCRGRHDSGGAWDPFVPERRDGKDTIDWIAKQPWSDGKVGMIGASYSGLVQWSAAVERPEALKCIIPQVSPPDAMLNIPYDQGVFMMLPNLWWTNLVRDKVSHMERASQPLPHPEKLLTLPLSKLDDAVLGTNVPFFDNWLKREGMNRWKGGFDFVSDLRLVEIPALHISGWWDGDGIGTKTNWAAMRAAGRQNQWLIYGPWPHGFNASEKFADMNYGPSSVLELDSVYLRWFDTWLKGKDVGWEKTPKVQAFVTGANRWANLADWPEKGSPELRLYLANGKDLVGAPASGGKAASYVYDPKKVKLPDLKGANLMAGGSTIVDLKDFRKGDALTFQSAKLKEAMTITGPISVELYFSTNVVSTDFFGFLLDVDEKGVARLICQPGKIDVRYLSGLSAPKLIKPGQVYKANIGIWDVAHQFKKGHRLVLAITSQMFPTYARNLNTGEPLFSATKMKVAKQTIYQDKSRPSALVFRVLK
jgi:uncharacterized protein